MGQGLEIITEADRLDRSTVSYPIFDRQKCLGCGRCAVSCFDGGHQAIAFGPDRVPKLLGANSVGAIQPGARVPKPKCLQPKI